MNYRIYLTGCIILAPVSMVVSDSLMVVGLSLLYGAAIWFSPKYSSSARRFWRRWYRESFRVINSFR